MFSFICVWINSWVNNREAGIWDAIAPIMTSFSWTWHKLCSCSSQWALCVSVWSPSLDNNFSHKSQNCMIWIGCNEIRRWCVLAIGYTLYMLITILKMFYELRRSWFYQMNLLNCHLPRAGHWGFRVAVLCSSDLLVIGAPELSNYRINSMAKLGVYPFPSSEALFWAWVISFSMHYRNREFLLVLWGKNHVFVRPEANIMCIIAAPKCWTTFSFVHICVSAVIE